jgi:transposase
MSLKSLPIPAVPEETARVAQAVFPRGNVFMQVRDMLGTIYTDEAFADLFPSFYPKPRAALGKSP